MNDVKLMRQSLGLTAVRFAQLVGCSHISVYNWERGISRPSPMAREKLKKIARKLETKKSEDFL
jgi:DNA-binding transcriptional regulator YiaG